MKTKLIKIIAIAIITSLWAKDYFFAFAEPYYFMPNTVELIKSKLKDSSWSVLENIEFLDNSYEKISALSDDRKKYMLSDIYSLKEEYIKNHLYDYVNEKYFSWTSANIKVKSFQKSFQIAKIKDIYADMHPNYMLSIENKIKGWTAIDENSNEFKIYAYMTYKLGSISQDQITTEKRLSSLWNFALSDEYNSYSWSYETKFNKLIQTINANPFSKIDFEKAYSKALKENISPNSDYIKWLLFWYAKYKSALWRDLVAVSNTFPHSKQSYSLSCEVNSAKDIINFLSKDDFWKNINEDTLFTMLPSYSWALQKLWDKDFQWGDPDEVFVGSIDGKQSYNTDNFTGYWVYAKPLVPILSSILKPSKLKPEIKEFNENDILESINAKKPVMFWYLTPVKIWKWYWYRTTPIKWKTASWKVVNWYVWEHVWVIIWALISKEWKIKSVYIVEWKTDEPQKIDFNTISAQASFFNQMIVIKDI